MFTGASRGRGKSFNNSKDNNNGAGGSNNNAKSFSNNQRGGYNSRGGRGGRSLGQTYLSVHFFPDSNAALELSQKFLDHNYLAVSFAFACRIYV